VPDQLGEADGPDSLGVVEGVSVGAADGLALGDPDGLADGLADGSAHSFSGFVRSP